MSCLQQFYQCLVTVWAYVWYYPYLPQIGLRSIMAGQIGWRSPASFQWRYWIIMLTLAYMTIYGQGIWYLQRGLNLFREYCYCDAIRVIRMSDTVEGLGLWMTEDRAHTLKYFVCRSMCP